MRDTPRPLDWSTFTQFSPPIRLAREESDRDTGELGCRATTFRQVKQRLLSSARWLQLWEGLNPPLITFARCLLVRVSKGYASGLGWQLNALGRQGPAVRDDKAGELRCNLPLFEVSGPSQIEQPILA